jgi:hypothetical protein
MRRQIKKLQIQSAQILINERHLAQDVVTKAAAQRPVRKFYEAVTGKNVRISISEPDDEIGENISFHSGTIYS